METFGVIIILIILVAIGFLILYTNRPSKTLETSENLTISSVEEARAFEQRQESLKEEVREKEQLESDIDSFKEMLEKAIKERQSNIKNDKSDEEQVNLFYIGEYQKLLNLPYDTREALQSAEWLYNDGKLRTQEEIHSDPLERYFNSNYGHFNVTRHIVNLFSFLIPFIITVTIVSIAIDFPLVGVPIGLLAGLFFGYIGMLIGYSINKSNARDLGLENTPAYQEEDSKQKIGIASGLLAGRSIYKHTKGAAKDIMNVDGWKEMK